MLLRCINRLVEPEAGRIVFRDIDITSLSGRPLRHIRRRIGMVFQEFNLVNRLSVIDNVLTGRAGSTSAWRCWFKARSEEHTSELQSLMRISYAVFCLKKKKTQYEQREIYLQKKRPQPQKTQNKTS